MIGLQYKQKGQRAWRKSSLRMHPNGLENMKRDSVIMAASNGWEVWQIIDDDLGVIWVDRNESVN